MHLQLYLMELMWIHVYLSEFRYNYFNNNIIICIFSIVGAAIVISFFRCCLFCNATNHEASLNIILSIKLDAIIVEIVQLTLYSGVQSSTGAVDCNTQVIHNVCAVFCVFIVLYFRACICCVVLTQQKEPPCKIDQQVVDQLMYIC